ncbi:MFS transporter [Peribacillus sp. SCS-26]|uniref:MFS transporter n=1 Tax=Paraperibacillus marinus TaxID=3115295 RepID=UPI003906935D
METKSLFKNKQYVYLISSQLVSNLGDWLDLLALMALVSINWQASPMQLTGLMLCFSIPIILWGPFAGVLADRYDRKKLMIIADLARAAAALGVVFAPSIWVLYALIFFKSSFSALFIPAKNGKLKEIVPETQMQQAVSLSAMIDNGSKVLGPMISGLAVASIGVQLAFYLDAASFVVSALLLLGLKSSLSPAVSESAMDKKKGLFQEMGAGFAFLKTMPAMLFGLIVMSSALLVLQIADTQIMILLRDIPGEPVNLVGYAMSASGAGMFIMSAYLSKKKITSLTGYMSAGAIIVGGGFAGVVFLTGLPPAALNFILPALFFFVGGAAAGIFIPFNVLAQKSTPVHMSGRTFGTINSVTTIAAIIGMVLGGILVETLGIKTAFVMSGSLLILIGIGTAFVKTGQKGSVALAESERGIQKEA